VSKQNAVDADQGTRMNADRISSLSSSASIRGFIRDIRVPFSTPAIPLLLIAWCGVLFYYGLDAGPLYRTEALRAIIGAECLRGHWLYPVLYGEPFLTKPPGHYVAIALCSLPFGEVTAASARLPSAIAATATVALMTWLLVQRGGLAHSRYSGGLAHSIHSGGLAHRLRGTAGKPATMYAAGKPAALWAVFLLPTSVLWLDKAPSAEIDMTLVGWVTAALVLFYQALKYRGAPSVGLLSLSLLCVALGTLTKWTAPAFFYLTIVPLLAWRGELRLLFGWRHLFAVSIAVGLCSLWVFAVAQQVGWDALIETIRGEVAYRFNPPPKAKGYPWSEVVTYPLLVLAAHLPLSLFALRTLRRSYFHQSDERGRLLLQLLHCWVWPNLLFWALVPNHNVRYALPISPALMALGVLGLLGQWRPNPPTPFPKREGGDKSESPLAASERGLGVRWFVCVLILWLIVKVVFVEVVVPQRCAGRNAEATAKQLRDAVPADRTLHVFKLKDEGITFYYGRPVRKLHDPRDLPRPAYVLLIHQEWTDRAAFGDAEVIQWMYDQQGAPIVLVKCH